MRRDPELERKILLKIEQLSAGKHSELKAFSIAGAPYDNLRYELEQMVMDELILAYEEPDTDDEELSHWTPRCLTPKGHRYLDVVRDEKIWRKAKTVLKNAPSVTLKMLVEAALPIELAHLLK